MQIVGQAGKKLKEMQSPLDVASLEMNFTFEFDHSSIFCGFSGQSFEGWLHLKVKKAGEF